MKTCTNNAQKGLAKTLTKHAFLLRLVLTGGMALAVTGCSSLTNIGSPDYSCSPADGAKCKSTVEVYEMTHNGNIPDPEEVTGKKSKKRAPSGKREKTTNSSSEAESEEGSDKAKKSATIGDSVIDTYVAPRLPDRPIPIRTPAHVMRIWIAPWEDTNGDLNTTGYMYTEIEERRWVIGDSNTSAQPTLRPLQTIQSEDN